MYSGIAASIAVILLTFYLGAKPDFEADSNITNYYRSRIRWNLSMVVKEMLLEQIIAALIIGFMKFV